MQIRTMIVAASALLFGVSFAVPRVGAAAAQTNEAQKGLAIFTAQGCYLCHGRVGQGARGVGATLVPLRMDEPALNAFLRHPSGSMPLYNSVVLSDADIAAIAAYLRSLPAPRSAAQISLLANYTDGAHVQAAAFPTDKAPAASSGSASSSDGTGKTAFAEHCAGCHGPDRQGGVGPSLQAEGQKRDADGVAQIIKAPPPGMPKLPLSGPEISAIASFVVSR